MECIFNKNWKLCHDHYYDLIEHKSQTLLFFFSHDDNYCTNLQSLYILIPLFLSSDNKVFLCLFFL